MTEKELKSLPSFLSEDGKRRYYNEDGHESFVYDEYGRVLRYEYFGDIVMNTYDDENHIVEKVYFWADTGEYGKYTFEMPKHDLIENSFKEWDEVREESALLNIISDESDEIMKQAEQYYRENPDCYPEPEEMFSILGLI